MPDCSLCSKQYARAEHLRRHLESAHAIASGIGGSVRKEHRCNHPGCGRLFIRSDALLRHKRGHERNADGGGRRIRALRGTSGQYSTTATPTAHRGMSPVKTTSMDILAISPMSDQEGGVVGQSQPSMWPPVTGDREPPGHWVQQPTPSTLDQSQYAPQRQASPSQTSGPSEHRLSRSAHFYLPSSSSESVPAWQYRQSLGNEEQQQQNDAFSSNGQAVLPDFGLLDRFGFQAVETGSTGSMGDHNFTGLDWIFDDATDFSADTSTVPDLVSAFEGDWQGRRPIVGEVGDPCLNTSNNDDIFGGSTTELDTTETLNLLNLANTALNMSGNGQSKVILDSLTRTRKADGEPRFPSSQQQEEDGAAAEDSWPQEYRPMRKKPPTIELTAISLEDGLLPTPETAPYQDDMILIDDAEEEKSTPSRWKVSNETRQKLLSYLTYSCKHPWSIYSFSATPPSTFLTSAQLEKLVDLFFSKFHPYVPMLHAATFDAATAPPILLLIVITIGLVFYPSEVARRSEDNMKTSASILHLRKRTSTLSVAFSELVRIGVMSAYEADQRGFTDIIINQAWLLQQIFGLGSGDKRLNKLAERNRGGIVTAIRRLGLLSHSREPQLKRAVNDLDQDAESRHRLWRSWITTESRLRLGWFVYLYDSKYGCYLDVAPMLRHAEVNAVMPCHADLWNAESAEVWTQRCQKERSDGSSAKNLLGTLRQLLQPSKINLPMHLNPLEAYILAVTLYQVRWDASKQRLLFDEGNASSKIDVAAAKAMHRLSEAAAVRRGTNSVVLAADVQLLHLLGALNFTGPPLFFDKLRDAAGRGGMSSIRRREAIVWLQDWMDGSRTNRMAMRRMLAASAQVFALVYTSLQRGHSRTGMQSNMFTVGLFQAALAMWAYTQFAVEESSPPSTSEGVTNPRPAVSSGALPRLSPDRIAAVREAGLLDLILTPGSGDNLVEYEEEVILNSGSIGRRKASAHAELVEAWVCGEYISTEDEKVHDWPLSSSAVSIVGIGPLNELTRRGSATPSGKGSRTTASHVLERFAMLLARHDWGLAASFRLVLLHMARHAVK